MSSHSMNLSQNRVQPKRSTITGRANRWMEEDRERSLSTEPQKEKRGLNSSYRSLSGSGSNLLPLSEPGSGFLDLRDSSGVQRLCWPTLA